MLLLRHANPSIALPAHRGRRRQLQLYIIDESRTSVGLDEAVENRMHVTTKRLWKFFNNR